MEVIYMGVINILIVDDSGIAVKKYSAMLKEFGLCVVGSARNGLEAINEYKKFRPDVVLMDITMPKLDGISATKEIIQQDPNAIIVMVTSHDNKQTVIDALAAGSKNYLIKPIEAQKLKNVIIQTYSRYKVAPSDEKADLSENEAVPSEDKEASSKDEVTATENKLAVPVEDEAVSQGENATTSEDKTASHEENATTSEDKTVSQGETATTSEDKTASQLEKATTSEDEPAPSEDKVAHSEEEVVTPPYDEYFI
jgi:two-component system chemotaxis response regulator CheY